MQDVINIHAAKTQLSRLVERAEQGEEVIIARAGRPVAKLVPYVPARKPRQLGIYKGQIALAQDFDTLPDEIAAPFSGEGPLYHGLNEAKPGEQS